MYRQGRVSIFRGWTTDSKGQQEWLQFGLSIKMRTDPATLARADPVLMSPAFKPRPVAFSITLRSRKGHIRDKAIVLKPWWEGRGPERPNSLCLYEITAL